MVRPVRNMPRVPILSESKLPLPRTVRLGEAGLVDLKAAATVRR